jgi:hypothetical protein
MLTYLACKAIISSKLDVSADRTFPWTFRFASINLIPYRHCKLSVYKSKKIIITTHVSVSIRIACKCPPSFEASIVEVGTLVGSIVVPFSTSEDGVTAAVLVIEGADEGVPVDCAVAVVTISLDAAPLETTSEEPDGCSEDGAGRLWPRRLDVMRLDAATGIEAVLPAIMTMEVPSGPVIVVVSGLTAWYFDVPSVEDTSSEDVGSVLLLTATSESEEPSDTCTTALLVVPSKVLTALPGDDACPGFGSSGLTVTVD